MHKALIIKYLESINYRIPLERITFSMFSSWKHQSISSLSVSVFIENNSENSFNNELLKAKLDDMWKIWDCVNAL